MVAGFAGSASTALRSRGYTFVRPGELRHAEWDEFDPDLAIWTIPGHKMKMGREHRVPLCTQAMKLLEDLYPISGNGKYLFPSIRSNERPMSDILADPKHGRTLIDDLAAGMTTLPAWMQSLLRPMVMEVSR